MAKTEADVEANLQKHLANLSKAIADDLDDQVIKQAEQCLAIKPDEEILMVKLVALAKAGKYQQAQQVLSGIKKSDNEVKFLKGYLAYRLGNYQEATDLAEGTLGDSRMTLLKSQVLTKRENYEAACNILAGLLVENSPENQGIAEELCANFFNSMALYVWNLVSSKKTVTLSQPMKNGLAAAIKYCQTQGEKIDLREVFLNLCILLAIDTTFKVGLFTAPEFQQYSREFLTRFETLLQRDEEQAMDTEGESLGEKEKDRLIAQVISVIFDKKRNKIKVLDSDHARQEQDYHKLSDDDIFLKTSVLSYLLFIKMNTNNLAELHLLTKDIDNILANLKKSKLTKKLQEIISTNLQFNRAITLLLRGKFQDVKELDLSNDIWDNLSVKSYIYTKNKKVEAVEELQKELNSNTPRDRFLLSLLQIGSYHLLNNQTLYTDKFVEFMQVK
jgi:tetratricopeptide (TPR) repeat protein